MTGLKLRLSIALILTMMGQRSIAQKFDSLYYRTYTNQVTGRFYFSKKYTSLRYKSAKDNFSLNYRPNTTLNMGVGATYKWATLNLAYGFGFLNPGKDKGKTHYLDLQFHNYARKFSLDMAGQFYRGFYLFPKGTGSLPDTYYVRPDIRINEIGGTFQYIVNHKRFSYRAAFLMNEWQRRSAGSFLVGIEMYTGRIRSDSTLIPATFRPEVVSADLDLFRFVEFGPNAGYAYTLVINRNFFLTGSAAVSLDYGVHTSSYAGVREKRSGFSPNSMVRFFGGYNSSVWGVSIAYINSQVELTTGNFDEDIVLNTGNVRLYIVYRFIPSPRQRKYLDIIQ